MKLKLKFRKFNYSRPKFSGRAAFKTLLKRNGFSVPKNFYGFGCCIARKDTRLFRFRFGANAVDVSCVIADFDRWANSTASTFSSIDSFKAQYCNKA